MVTIIDPHIKREGGYHIHEASFNNLTHRAKCPFLDKET